MALASLSYALVLDGWLEASKHFIVGKYIVYPAKEVDADPVLHLLAFAPLHEDETNFTVENHANFIKATLNWYSLSADRLFCSIGDNYSASKATAKQLGVPLLGCRSHRFIILVEQYLRTFLATELELVGLLGADCDIIHDKHLESAILKIQSKKENTLTDLEKGAVNKLLLSSLLAQDEPGAGDICDDAELSFAERALKRQRVQDTTEGSKYVNTRFLLPTSCVVVERLFSQQAKQVFSPHWRRLNPRMLLGGLAISQSNRMLWNLALVALVVNEGVAEEELDVDQDEVDDDDELLGQDCW
ncbi:hypothetical protein MHU86_22864 [Fragilaria crotonensis]|nr:hypothetical protein MHU86_22864 [Fragilaria crotonensis]